MPFASANLITSQSQQVFNNGTALYGLSTGGIQESGDCFTPSVDNSQQLKIPLKRGCTD
jgi:hypothetical protein